MLLGPHGPPAHSHQSPPSERAPPYLLRRKARGCSDGSAWRTGRGSARLLGLPTEHQGLEETPGRRARVQAGPSSLSLGPESSFCWWCFLLSPPAGHPSSPEKAPRCYRSARSRLWPPNWKKDRYASATALLKSLLQKESGDEAWAGTGGPPGAWTGAGGAIKGKALVAPGTPLALERGGTWGWGRGGRWPGLAALGRD